jgi:hypothetical protein
VHGELGIFAVGVKNRQTRHFGAHFGILFKEGPAEVKILPVFQRVPFIAPETFMAKHGEWLVGRIDGNQVLFAQITFVPVIILVIPERDPPLLAAIRAQSWLGHGHFMQDLQVIPGDFEAGVALAAVWHIRL